VFFNARKYHVLALEIFKLDFKNNLMIGVTKRPTTTFKDLIACFGSYKAVSPKDDMLNITGNVCQGS
jgi:hypothetical protein